MSAGARKPSASSQRKRRDDQEAEMDAAPTADALDRIRMLEIELARAKAQVEGWNALGNERR
jgi:hypothetical protein